MALIIETGNVVPGANSFVTAEQARAYALARGITIAAEDPALEGFLIKAMDFLEAQRAKLQGTKVVKDQALQWPRTGVQLDGFDVEETEIPQVLKDAQCQLAIALDNGDDIMPDSDGRVVVRKKLDVIETEYADTGSGPPAPVFAKVMALLEPLFQSAAVGVALQTGRL